MVSVTIALSADPEERLAELRVADTGPGLSAESRARLFEPFMQADETLNCAREGLGLGLALVKELVELHGGSVEARSEGQGKGAEFIVRLPLAAKTAAGAGREEVAPVSSPCRRVLVIEDNVDAADSLGELLELVGHTVAVAYTGPDGIAKAQDFHPDVLLCDIGLPGMDGYAVALAFRSDERLRDVHMVALTGYALPEDLERATQAGFAYHLAKPPSLEQLEKVLGSR